MTAHLDTKLVLELDADAYVHGQQIVMSTECAYDLMRQLARELGHKPTIAAWVSASFGLKEQQIHGRSRLSEVVLAKRFTMLLCEEQGMGQGEISRFLGIDHTAVCNGLRQIKSDLSRNKPIQRRLEQLRQELQLLEQQTKEQA